MSRAAPLTAAIIQPIILIPTRLSIIADTEPRTYTNQEWREKQERFWNKQLKIAKWLNWITVTVGAVALGSLYFLYIQADAARTAAEIALKQLRIGQRPWVGITDAIVSTPLFFATNRSEIAIKFTFTNSGASIANRVWHTGSVLFTRNFNEATKFETSACGLTPPPIGLAYLILPGQSRPVTTQFHNSSPKIDVDESGNTQMWLVGCVFYFDQLNTVHRTPFIYGFNTDKGRSFRPSGEIKGELRPFPTATTAD